MKKQQVLFLVFLGLFSAGLVCLLLGIVLYWTGSSQPGDETPTLEISNDPGEKAAQEIARAANASVSETGSREYPWGSVRVFEGLSQENDRVMIEVDRLSGTVTAYETYGSQPTKALITSDQAIDAAEQFLESYVPDLDLDGYQRTISTPEEGALLQAFRVEWQKYAPSGAKLPQKVVIYVNGEAGQVRHFLRTNLPVKIDTNPKISSNEILVLLQKLETEPGQELVFGEPSLVVIPDNSAESGQRLVWIFPVAVRDIFSEQIPLEGLAFDANTGKKIDLEDLFTEE